MKAIHLALIGVALAGPALAQDETTSRPSIVVTGTGKVERAPDAFALSASLEGRGATQVEALERLAHTQAAVRTGLSELRGVSSIELFTAQPSVEPTYAPACGTVNYTRDTSDCPIAGYVAVMGLTAEGSPAERGGDAVSLASELGAREARIVRYFLRDDADLRDRANALAFQDAQRQADALATASGQRVVRILRIQRPREVREDFEVMEVLATESLMVSADRAPRVVLDVAPPPVELSSRLTVIFEIE